MNRKKRTIGWPNPYKIKGKETNITVSTSTDETKDKSSHLTKN